MCCAYNDIWPWSVSSRSFSHKFCNKTAKILTFFGQYPVNTWHLYQYISVVQKALIMTFLNNCFHNMASMVRTDWTQWWLSCASRTISNTVHAVSLSLSQWCEVGNMLFIVTIVFALHNLSYFSSCLAWVFSHYSEVTWALWLPKSLNTQLFVQQLFQAGNKVNIKAVHYWPFVRGIHWWLVETH